MIWSIKSGFNIFCNVRVNACFYVDYEAVSINVCFFSIFSFYVIIQKLIDYYLPYFMNICVFSFLWVIHFLEIILLYDSLFLTLKNFFSLQVLQVWYPYVFLFFHSFPKNSIMYQLKKIFLEWFLCIFLTFVFISMYGSNQAFCLNLVSLCTFFNTNPWFNACF